MYGRQPATSSALHPYYPKLMSGDNEQLYESYGKLNGGGGAKELTDFEKNKNRHPKSYV